MAVRSMEMGLVAVLMTMLWAGASAQLSCTPTIMSLSPCLNYITGNSSTPSPSCCSQLASVVRSQAQCLCMLFNGSSSSMGFNFNQTQALALPGACNVQTPPISQCNAASGPVTSPGDSPAEAPVEAPASPPTSATATAPVTPPPSVPITPSTKPSSPAVPSQTPPSAPSIPRNGSKTVPSTSGGVRWMQVVQHFSLYFSLDLHHMLHMVVRSTELIVSLLAHVFLYIYIECIISVLLLLRLVFWRPPSEVVLCCL